MIRIFRAAWLVLLLALPVAMAQPGAAQTTAVPAAAVPAAAQPLPTPQQAEQALAVLKDDSRRAAMISVLETIARATPLAAPAVPPAMAPSSATGPAPAGTTPAGAGQAAKPATAAPAAATPAAVAKLVIPLAPDSLGAELLIGVSDRLEALSTDISNSVRALTNFGLLQRWVRGIAEDPDSRAEVFDATWKLLVVAVLSLAIEAGVKRLLRRPRRALLAIPAEVIEAENPKSASVPGAKKAGDATAAQQRNAHAIRTMRRVPLVVARLLLDLIPVMAMGLVGYGLLGSQLGEPTTTKLVILALLDAYVLSRILTLTTRALLSPDSPGLRLFRVDEQLGWTALRWMRRLAVVALFGYAITEVALLFGLYRVAHDALLKIVSLAVHMMLVVIVIQNRAPIARLIRTDRTGVIAGARNRFAAVWHIVVIFYLVALWAVWALNVPGGFRRLLLVFVSTVVIGGLARLLSVILVAWLDHALAPPEGVARRPPGLDHTMRRYLPVLKGATRLLVIVVALVALLQIWGFDSLDWFYGNALGGRLVSATTTSAITIAISLAIWEGSNAAVQSHLSRLARDGHPARSARIRTLLPMMRTTLMVAITLFAGLTVLSQIGVNIAPLLAGAGVVGLAIGFGSQKLVQDIITGLFLLLENIMQVGDVVTLAGLTGTVENLSIRTIRLRALDGAVHIVPFSAVTTVTNLTRDFAYAMLDISIGLNEEPDAIGKIVQEVAETMRRETRWGPAITESMEIMGVERFIDTAWVLRCRLKTVPSQRWAVGRELNRRIKYRFDELAIESPFTSYKALAAASPPPPNAKTPDEAGQAAA